MPDDIERDIAAAHRWAGRVFTANRPAFADQPLTGHYLPAWWAGDRVYPPIVRVMGDVGMWRLSPPVKGYAAGNDRMTSRSFRFQGLGSVALVGRWPLDGGFQGVQFGATVEPAALSYLMGLGGGAPKWAEGVAPRLLQGLAPYRLQIVLCGLLAQCYLDHPELLGGPHPLLAEYAATWDRADDVVVRINPMMTDLRHPETWTF